MLKDNASFKLHNASVIRSVALMSFFCSLSSLMVFSLLPAFLVDELEIGHSQIGIFEGLAISSAFVSKFFSGFLSDIFKQRKPLIMIGTVMSALSKPLFAICTGAGLMFSIRLTDRLSKGIRSAPTDALVADLSEPNLYASNFGLRQTFYTLGAVAGSLIAMVIMLLSNNNYRLVFALSAIPALLTIFVLWFLVRPHPNSHPRANSSIQYQKISLKDLKSFSPAFWWLMTASFFLMLARFSEAFLTLKAKEAGWAIAYLPVLYIIMDLVHAGIAWPAGIYADRLSRKQMLFWGLMVMTAGQTVLAYVSTIGGVLIGILLVGLHMGMTQGLLKALIAQSTPAELRGTAFSLFFITSGFAIFLGNAIAGNLSHKFGFYATFLAASSFTASSMAILYFAFLRQKIKKTVPVVGT
jgi:MFS family permease